MLIDDARGMDAHVTPVSVAYDQLMLDGLGAGDYVLLDRSLGGGVVYGAGGGQSEFDFAGNENTFVLDASSEFDFFGYSYAPGYSDDSEIVVIQGDVAGGVRSIELGESSGGVDDWDVISFDGLNAGVSIDLSSASADTEWDVTVTVPGSGTAGTPGTPEIPSTPDDIVAYVDGAEGIFGTDYGDSLSGDAGSNILHGGAGGDTVSGGLGDDLISGGAGSDIVYGGYGRDVLIDLDGGDTLYGDNGGSSYGDNDRFIVGKDTKIGDFDLSPDGAGLSGRSNQVNDIVFVQVTAASLAAAGFSLNQIYELVSGKPEYMQQWRQFVKDVEIEVVPDTTTSNGYNEIRLSIDGDGDGSATDLGSISFLEAGEGSGNYNAVKMKTKIEDIMAQFGSSGSDNAHVLEQFFGMDELTAGQIAALEAAVDAGEAVEDSGGDTAAVINAIESELAGEMFDAADEIRAVLTSQQNATPSDVIAVVEDVIDDAVDEALAASDMDTSLFVPIGVEEIREGTVRTEVIEDRDSALSTIATVLADAEQAALDAGATAEEAEEQAKEAAADKREELLGVTTIVQREAEPESTSDDSASEPEAAPEAIVVMSNADDKVISTSGADDRFEVVPQVFVDDADQALSNQDFGKDVIVDLSGRSEGVDVGGASGEETTATAGASGEETAQINLDALGDVVYLEGVDSIDDVDFARHQVGREGMNSLKISTTVQSTDDQGNPIANEGEVNIFKQFDPMTDRFAVETLEVSDTQGNSTYWSLSTEQAVREGGRVTDTFIQTDVSNTGKGILIGSDSESDTYVVTGSLSDASAEVKVVGFDSDDTIDVSGFAGVDEELTATINEDTGAVELSVDDEVRLTLLGTGMAEEDLSTALILSESS
jgi:hypothetical protein